MRSEFDKYAASYEGLLRDPIRDRFVVDAEFFHKRKWDLLSSFFHKARFDTAIAAWLDVGCGKGALLQFGRPAFKEVAGCDPSAEMLRSECEGIQVVMQSDPLTIPFPDERFDVLTAVCVYHHVQPSARAALTNEAVRVLKPGGWFVVIEHNPWNPATRWIVRRTPVDAEARLLTATQSRELLAAAGLRVLNTRYFLYFPERLYARVGRLESLLAHVPAGGQYAVFATKSPAVPDAGLE